MTTEQKGITAQVVSLKNRKAEVTRKMEQAIDKLAEEMAANAHLIDQKERELNDLRQKHRGYEAAAKRYLDGTVNLFDMNIVKFPGGGGIGRARTDLKGKVLDTSQLRTTVSHRFAESGEVVVGHLDEAKAKELNGKPFEGTSKELVDALYKVESGEGFSTYTSGRGVKLNPLAVYKDKGRGGLVDAPLSVVS